MTTRHHPAEELTTDRYTCLRTGCGHDQNAHGTYSDTSSRCYGTRDVAVRAGVPTAVACNCARFTRHWGATVLAVVGTLAVIWAVSHGLAMVR
jgi:hypothetical protein